MPPLERLWADERGVEGLPIRLVIGVVVGVASLGVMLNMISGVGTLAVSELDAVPSPEVVTTGGQTIQVTAVDAEGDPVTDATVVVRGETATLDAVAIARTGPNGTASVEIDPGLSPNQADGRLSIEVKPPAGSSYVDRRENTAILVIRE